MPREGVLSNTVRQSIRLEHFVFHVIDTQSDEPHYLDRVELTNDQAQFFEHRIAEASVGNQYQFRDSATGTPSRCAEIVDDPTSKFLEESKNLTRDFHEHHLGNVNSGAFVVAHFSIEIDGVRISMIAMLKMDHKKVYEYFVEQQRRESVARMREVVESFVEDKTAIQKAAIVDITDTFDWDILASERRNPDGIAHYFRIFLHAVESETPSKLTQKAVTAVGEWSRANQDALPESPRHYRQRAIGYMEHHGHFDTDQFVDMVVYERDPEKKDNIVSSLTNSLEEKGIAGQRFSTRPDSIKSKVKRTTLKTEEGVNLTWEGPDEAANISVSPNPDENGMYTITIRTQRYYES